MELVTGVGEMDHINSQDDADFQRAITGPGNYVLNIGRIMEAELLANNIIRVHDGSLIHQGRHVIIPEGESEEVIFEYGTQGEKRYDLLVAAYTKDTTTGIESEILKALKGVPAAEDPELPSYVEGDVRAGDIYAEFPLYKVELDGINIVSIEPLYEVLTSVAELKAMTDELNGNLTQQTFTASDFGINTSTWQVVSWDCIKIGKMVYLNAELYTSAVIVPNNTYTIGSNAASGLRPQATAFPSATAFKSTYGNAVPCACIVGADGTTRLNLPYADRPYVAIHAVYRTS